MWVYTDGIYLAVIFTRGDHTKIFTNDTAGHIFSNNFTLDDTALNRSGQSIMSGDATNFFLTDYRTGKSTVDNATAVFTGDTTDKFFFTTGSHRTADMNILNDGTFLDVSKKS